MSAEEHGPRQRLANALRRAVDLSMAGQYQDEVLARAALAAEELNRLLAGEKTLTSNEPFDAQKYLAGDFRRLYSPTTGLSNPVAPPVRLTEVDGADGGPREILGYVSFGYAYEGVPNCVHGGVIAQTLDEILGAANQAAGTVGMTGTMSVRYRKPTPSRTELKLVARMLRREGRKLFSWAGIYDGETLTAEAEGLFIVVAQEQFASIAGL